MCGEARLTTQMPDGVGGAEVRTLTIGGPTSPPSAAFRGFRGRGQGSRSRYPKSKWEALLNFPPHRISGKRQVDFVLV